MITISQIRAARALLNWTQMDLAKKCHLSLRALNSLESGLSVPRLETLRRIEEILDKADIEFLEFDGVRRKTERLQILKFEGVHCLEQHLLDVMQHMRGPGEILLNLGSEEKYAKLRQHVLDDYFRYIWQHKITERALVADGETYMIGRPTDYRWIQPEAFNKVAYIVYGPNVAFLIPGKPHRAIIVRNPSMAEMFRKQFEYNWAQAKIPWYAKRYKDPRPQEPWSMAKAAAAREWVDKDRGFR